MAVMVYKTKDGEENLNGTNAHRADSARNDLVQKVRTGIVDNRAVKARMDRLIAHTNSRTQLRAIGEGNEATGKRLTIAPSRTVGVCMTGFDSGVVQRVHTKAVKAGKKRSRDEDLDDGNVSVCTDFDEKNTDFTIEQSYKSKSVKKNGKKITRRTRKKSTKTRSKKEMSGEAKKVVKLRNMLRPTLRGKNGRKYISRAKLQLAMREVNGKAQGALGVAVPMRSVSDRNNGETHANKSVVGAKTPGVLANYLSRMLTGRQDAQKVDKVKRPGNKGHVERLAQDKLIEEKEDPQGFAMVVDRPLCDECENDDQLKFGLYQDRQQPTA